MSPGSEQAPRGGIDLGGTKIQTVVVDVDNNVLGQSRRPTPTTGGPEDVAREMEGAMRDAAAEAGLGTRELLGVGIGSPGDADEETGVVSGARNLPGWLGSYPLGERLSKDLGVPVRVGNDVQVAVQGEFELGAAKEFDTILGVWWGTGVGGGLVLDGKPWLGRGAAAEIGHVVVKMGGPRCTCGRKGCMEAYAGRMAMEVKARKEVKNGAKTDLFRIMEERGRDRLTSGVWERALKHGDDLAIRLMDRAVKALGAGVASCVNVIDPEAVIIGGGLGVRMGERYVRRIAARMHPHLFVDDRPPEMRLAALGDLGGAIGAALLVDERVPAAAT
ncbi:MAG TPA: ROK family protein [Solirubrobacterales bacterium]|nr:ROK family protein [Solirubrobacterales bacterium]